VPYGTGCASLDAWTSPSWALLKQMFCATSLLQILHNGNFNRYSYFDEFSKSSWERAAWSAFCDSPATGFFTNGFIMKILVWNVQGAKKHQIREEIQYLHKAQQPDLVFLTETMASDETAKHILPQLGFDHYDYTLPVNHSGGIWVLWNKRNILANVLLKEDRATHMLVFDVISQKFSIISGVYAPAQPSHKDAFWTHLRNLNCVIDKPWCLIGDFNELECHTDKQGGPPAAPSQFIRLPCFLNFCQAVSLPIQGRSFTWKKRIHEHLIYEKLDRAIGRHDWCCQYPDSSVSAGPFTCSDHSYVLLDTNPTHLSK